MIKVSVVGVKKEMARVMLAIKQKAGVGQQVDRMVAALRVNTPVDTGNARDSWVKVTLPNGDFRVENNAAYIQQLNQGSSKQAPSHFIEATVLEYGVPIGEIVQIRRD